MFSNVEAIPTLKKKVSKIQHLEIDPQIESIGEDIKIAEPEVDIEPLVLVRVEIRKL